MEHGRAAMPGFFIEKKFGKNASIIEIKISIYSPVNNSYLPIILYTFLNIMYVCNMNFISKN